MFGYSVIQWLFFFYFYCFFGWCFESAYVSIKSRKFVNRGFMKGPFLPLYGSGAIMMLLVSKPFLQHWWAVYIAGCIGATLLEYVTGVVMEALFKVRYWDYSNQPFNFKGHICLSSSLAWGGLTMLMTYVIHKPVEAFVLDIPSAVLTIITVLLTVYIAGDFALAFKAALDLRDILVYLEKAKEEWNAKKELFAENMEQKKESIVDRLHMEQLKENMERMKNAKWMHKLFHNNPSMSSVRYREIMEEIRQKAEEKKKRK